MQNFIDTWRQNLKSEVRELIPNSMCINLDLDCFNEALARRIIELSTMSIRCSKEKEFLTACLTARSAVETLAVQFRLKTILDVDEFINLDDFKKVALGGRLEQCPIEQVSVLTLLGKLNKDYPGTQEFYECLCEISHPNMFGVLGHYCVRNFDSGQARFQSHPPENLFQSFENDLNKTVGTSSRIYNHCRQLIENKVFNKARSL